MSSQGQGERPYTQEDLVGNKSELIKLVQRQQSKWPEEKFHSSKVTVPKLKSALLDPTNGFTTNKPPVTSPHPSKSGSRSSVNPGTPQTSVNNSHETPAPNPVPQAPSLNAVELVSVRAYIEDCRFHPVQKTQARISIPLLDHNNCPLGSSRVQSRELLVALQQGNSAIEIPADSSIVRVSFADPEDQDWKIPFVRIHHGQAFDEMNFAPEALEIPENGRIKLFVDNLALPIPAIRNEEHPLTISQDGPSTSAHTEPGTETIQRDATETPAVKYLREKLATRAGYETFAANRGHVRSNPDAVKDWQFAVDFTRDYNKRKTPVKISKDTICGALGIGTSWLANAHTAVGIIGTYGQVSEVAEVLTHIDDPLLGATALLSFLTDWKKDHPM